MAMLGVIMAGLLAVQTTAPAPAVAGCPAGGAVPAEYQGWEAQQGVTAGTGIADPATLALGRSARATLVPVVRITFPAPSGHAAERGTMGGVFAVDADRPGTYRLALGAAVSADMAAGDKVLPALAHGHGPDCSGIGRYLDYRIDKPGRYLIQVAGSRTPELVLMVIRQGD